MYVLGSNNVQLALISAAEMCHESYPTGTGGMLVTLRINSVAFPFPPAPTKPLFCFAFNFPHNLLCDSVGPEGAELTARLHKMVTRSSCFS